MHQKDKAEAFRQMHFGDEMLILPGIWDALSAKVAHQAGYSAVAMASAPVSWSFGLSDGGNLTREQLARVVENVTRTLDIPVSCDIEQGYGETPDDVTETGVMILNAGAIAFNIEDSIGGGNLRPIEDMQARIDALKQANNKTGIPALINARVDAYLLGQSGDDVYKDTVKRAAAWKDAGADCIFIPGLADPDLIKSFARDIKSPINILVTSASMPTVAELHDMGIARLSTGPRLMQAAMGAMEKAARSLREDGDARFMNDVASAPALNKF